MLKKNDRIELEITSLGSKGEGIGRHEGIAVFVKDALPGDRAKVLIIKAKKNFCFGKLLSVLRPSTDRIRPICPVSNSCGGCQLSGLRYGAELIFKEEKVRSALSRIGGISEDELRGAAEPIFAMTVHDGAVAPERYRNKACFPFGKGRDGRIIAGFFAGRTHSIIECEDCLMVPEEFSDILAIVLEFAREYDVEPYDEVTGEGLLRHLLIRKGFKTGEIMVCLVIKDKVLPHAKELVSALLSVPGIESVVTNTNPDRTNVILGKRTRLLFGREHIFEEIGDLRFRISAASFFQVNPAVASALYDKAMEYAFSGLEEPVRLWDLCCGTGTMSLMAAKRGAHVYGIESNPEAVLDANENMRANNIDNVTFIESRVEDYLQKNSLEGDIVIMDPPRSGMEPSSLEAIISAAPSRIVYVSCDPATLARDLRYMLDYGFYRLEKYRTFDQFCRTCHVETVCLLSKGDVKSKKIRVEFSLEDMDTDGFKKGATYNAIRDWIKEKYGYRVTNLNIAQVKQKHGIIERENYNKPKSPDSKQPG
ncbi:MAG: 23S rRNA (uracil(1939)-C(5))-methyltransferase RlmD, partial [Lachnospiraceae bacterium]|nr:23S rRNA (uracil(1939)-C(5))-methyltransferase RlmD [Lachnospiraceae bacterium]